MPVRIDGAGAWMASGWNAVTSNFWTFVLLTLLYVVGGSVLPVVLQGPLGLGLQWAALRQVNGRNAASNDVNAGFQLIAPAILSCLIASIIVTLASMFLLVPGLIAAALLQLVYPLILDRGLSFSEAIAESISLSKPYLGSMVLLTLLQVGLIMAGLLLCGVGLLVAIPVNFAATAVAYSQICGLTPATRARLA
ncbi:MAG: hypothetical protein FJW30_18935 [Acidobacteria bacterium]|nr:hypothetical protein [Acidobacteriota bacterium]